MTPATILAFATRLQDVPFRPEGAIRAPCHECGAPVWADPEEMRRVGATGAICPRCSPRVFWPRATALMWAHPELGASGFPLADELPTGHLPRPVAEVLWQFN